MTRDMCFDPHVGLTDYDDEDVPMGWKLKDYPLHTHDWRSAFLNRVAEVGYIGLIEAAAHVYDCLSEPKALRCALIAQLSGVNGSGKLGIFNGLQSFLDDFLTLTALPPKVRGESLESRHAKVMSGWQTEREREEALIWKFAWILDGKNPTARRSD